MELSPPIFNFISYKPFVKEFRAWVDDLKLTKLKFEEFIINEIESQRTYN